MKKAAALFLAVLFALALPGLVMAGVVKKNAAVTGKNPTEKEGRVSGIPVSSDGGKAAPGESVGKTEAVLQDVTEGVYTIFIKRNGIERFLNVEGESVKNEANIQVAEQTGTAGEEFYLKPDADGSFQIVNVNSGKVLDITRGNIRNGNHIQQYSFVGYPDQLWYFRPFDGGWKIVSRASAVWGLSERVLNTEGDYVEIHEFDGSETQKWYLKRAQTD